MKKYGKIVDYDGYNGNIVSEDGIKYLMLKDNTDSCDIYKVGDIVSFVPEYYETIENNAFIARFIKKIEKEELS